MSTAVAPSRANSFLTSPLLGLFVRTALPITALMAMNGLTTVVDAYFLGAFVGADALGGVSLVFPITMLMVAAASVVGSGAASVLARLLGAGRHDDARAAFTSAHLLAVAVALMLMLAFALLGRDICLALAHGRAQLADLGWVYLAILMAGAPLNLIMGLNGDSLRSEGHVGALAMFGAVLTLANIGLDAWLIIGLDLGVVGSALGTVLAQALALAITIVYRARKRTILRLRRPTLAAWREHSPHILALGVPPGLSFMGVALGAAVTLHALGLWQTEHYAMTVAAFGVVTRLQSFAFLPLVGLNMATQTIVGNNAGARQWTRVEVGLKMGLSIALGYGLLVEAALLLGRATIGRVFIDDPLAAAEVARILPLLFMLFFVSGPSMTIAGYFQAIGDARRAAVLGLARTYLFLVPLTYLLAAWLGEIGIWLATPISSALSLTLAIVLLVVARRSAGATSSEPA
ncbi:MAG: MATE family efflux transporter [Burkholderiaceae bacterium]